MGWGRLDDMMDDDPRWWSLSLAAHGLWQACLPRCLRYGSPVVTRAHLWQVFRTAFDGEEKLAEVLVEHGLWQVVEDGWSYVADDWERIAYSEEKREAKRRAGRLGGHRSATVRAARYGTAQPPRVEARASDASEARSKHARSTLEAVPVPVPVPVVNPPSPTGTRPPQGDRLAAMRDGWNEFSGALPKVHVVPKAGERRRLMLAEWDKLGGDLDWWRRAVQVFAADEFNRSRRLSIDTLCRHDRWLDATADGLPPPAPVESKPVPENPIDRRIRAMSDGHGRVVDIAPTRVAWGGLT